LFDIRKIQYSCGTVFDTDTVTETWSGNRMIRYSRGSGRTCAQVYETIEKEKNDGRALLEVPRFTDIGCRFLRLMDCGAYHVIVKFWIV